jgi:hypothetical protein
MTKSSHIGGGNHYFHTSLGEGPLEKDYRHGSDVALCQTVLQEQRKSRTAAFAAGHIGSARIADQICHMAMDLLKTLHSGAPIRVLSVKQRAAMRRCLSSKKLALLDVRTALPESQDTIWDRPKPLRPPGK